MSRFDADKFIGVVYKNSCVWDQTDPNYPKRDYQRVAWMVIADEMKMNVYDLKKKWRGLRDTFGRELRKQVEMGDRGEVKWPFFKSLMFLKESMFRKPAGAKNRRRLSDSEDEAGAISDGEYTPQHQIVKLPRLTIGPLETNSSRITIKSVQSLKTEPLEVPIEMVGNPQCIQTPQLSHMTLLQDPTAATSQETTDADSQFLMSLLPFLKDAPKERKLHIRSRLLQVLIDEQNSKASALCSTPDDDPLYDDQS